MALEVGRLGGDVGGEAWADGRDDGVRGAGVGGSERAKRSQDGETSDHRGLSPFRSSRCGPIAALGLTVVLDLALAVALRRAF